MILLTHKLYGGLYDFDESKFALAKVLKCYHSNDGKESVTFSKFPYAYYQQDYREANEEDIKNYKHKYYNEDGSQEIRY